MDYQNIGIKNVAEECLEYQIELARLNSELAEIKERYKSRIAEISQGANTWAGLYASGKTQVIRNEKDTDWMDYETGVVITDLQTLPQFRRNNTQLEIEFVKTLQLD